METYIDNYVISDEPWYKLNVFNWIMYDLGNTIFSMVVVSITLYPVVYILYFNQGLSEAAAINKGNFAVSATLFIGNVMMAFVSPFLGAYSDQLERRKGLLLKISLMCILLMGSLTIVGTNNSVILFLGIFLFANFFYQMGLVIYDAMLPFITDKDKIGKVGGLGVAIGYFGSFLGIGMGYVFLALKYPDWYASNGVYTLGYIPKLYPVSAFMFFLFSIPLYFVKEKPVNTKDLKIDNLFGHVKTEVVKTGKEVFNYRDMKFFLFGWLIFVDVANTVILSMTAIVAVGLQAGEGSNVLVVLGIGIFSAVVFTYPVGVYVDKNGPKKGLTLILILWLSSLLLAFMTNLTIGSITTPKALLFVFPWIVGPALGGTWVVQRNYVTELAPPDKIGNYFGFSNIFGRISAAFGPLLWASTIWYLNRIVGIDISMSTRLALIALGLLMLVGFSIVKNNVSDVHEVYLNGGKATGEGTWVNDNGDILFDSRTD